jgi:hypothetical protein
MARSTCSAGRATTRVATRQARRLHIGMVGAQRCVNEWLAQWEIQRTFYPLLLFIRNVRLDHGGHL